MTDTLQVFCGVRLGHEIHAKYETRSCLNTDAYVRFLGTRNDALQVFCGVRLGHETKVSNVFMIEY